MANGPHFSDAYTGALVTDPPHDLEEEPKWLRRGASGPRLDRGLRKTQMFAEHDGVRSPVCLAPAVDRLLRDLEVLRQLIDSLEVRQVLFSADRIVSLDVVVHGQLLPLLRRGGRYRCTRRPRKPPSPICAAHQCHVTSGTSGRALGASRMSSSARMTFRRRL